MADQRVIAAISSINDPTRRALYDLVIERQPLARDDAADALGLPRSTVAFHLDRLVDAGLLATTTERRSGRTGPGAGRPAKLYSLASGEVAVSVPPRQYDLMADVLATAIETVGDIEPPAAAVQRVARARGREAGGDGRTLDDVLVETGYRPVSDDDGTILRNCPFHALAADHRGLVCAANHAFLCGVAEMTGVAPSSVVLEPAASTCCVRIHASG